MAGRARIGVVIAALGLVAFLLLCAVFWGLGRGAWPGGQLRITVSKETTYLTEPLTPAGYVDYLAAINRLASDGVTPEDNAAVLIVRVFGPREIPPENRDEFFRLLGIPPPSEKGDYYVDLAVFDKPRAAGNTMPGMLGDRPRDVFDDQAQAMSRPWSRGEFPAVAQWLDKNEKHLPTIIAASRRARFYAPLLRSDTDPSVLGALNYSIQRFREAARALEARAMLRLQEGKVREAWDDLSAIHRLGRLAAQGPMTIDTLIGIATDGMAYEGEMAVARYGRLTSKEAIDRIADLRALKPWPSLADKVNAGGRYQILDGIQDIAQGGNEEDRPHKAGDARPASGFEELAHGAGLVGVDCDRVLRQVNSWTDRFVEAMRTPARAERIATLAAILKKVDEAASERSFGHLAGEFFSGHSPRSIIADRIGLIMAALEAPALVATVQSEARAEAKSQLTLMALALAAYRADHGAYPETLSQLAPRYMSEVSADPCGDGPLHYRVANGEYTLYSLGCNGKDDGGHSHDDPEDKEAGSEQDDIVIRSAVLWKSP
jgi:hypothetical protein